VNSLSGEKARPKLPSPKAQNMEPTVQEWGGIGAGPRRRSKKCEKEEETESALQRGGQASDGTRQPGQWGEWGRSMSSEPRAKARPKAGTGILKSEKNKGRDEEIEGKKEPDSC